MPERTERIVGIYTQRERLYNGMQIFPIHIPPAFTGEFGPNYADWFELRISQNFIVKRILESSGKIIPDEDGIKLEKNIGELKKKRSTSVDVIVKKEVKREINYTIIWLIPISVYAKAMKSMNKSTTNYRPLNVHFFDETSRNHKFYYENVTRKL